MVRKRARSKFVKYNGKRQLFVYSVTDDGFMVCAMIPQSTILAQANTIKYVSVGVVIGINYNWHYNCRFPFYKYYQGNQAYYG